MKIGYNEVYESYRELVVQSENVSWSRFENFLVINSILVLAWATLFVEKNGSLKEIITSAKIVMTTISIFGAITGVAWSNLGQRSRSYLNRYRDKAKAIEEHHDKKDWWEDGIPITDRPFQIHLPPKCYSSSTILLIWIPLIFSVMHLILITVTWL